MTEAQAAPAPAKKRGGFLRELPLLIIVALALALVIKALFVQAFFIPSGSMEKTLLVHDRVLVNKVVYKFRDVHRGEIVVFNAGGSLQVEAPVPPAKGFGEKLRRKFLSAVGLGAPGEQDFIKRVIGIEGDVVACCTNDHVTVNGEELIEPYVYEDYPHPPFGPITVPKGKLFVMGDHRSDSSDSSMPDSEGNLRPIPRDKVIGRAFVVIWPPTRVKGLRVPSTFQAAAMSPPALGLVGAVPIVAIRRRRRRHVTNRHGVRV